VTAIHPSAAVRRSLNPSAANPRSSFVAYRDYLKPVIRACRVHIRISVPPHAACLAQKRLNTPQPRTYKSNWPLAGIESAQSATEFIVNQFSDPTQWDLTSETSNVVGQATAIGISAGGIGAAQLDQLKTRPQQTQAKLQAAQANPNNATATLAGITGEQISGDLLTATIWSWFAAAESHNRLSQNQANMVETPGLSYGLFHAIAQPV
jgi:hypothetical protein